MKESKYGTRRKISNSLGLQGSGGTASLLQIYSCQTHCFLSTLWRSAGAISHFKAHIALIIRNIHQHLSGRVNGGETGCHKYSVPQDGYSLAPLRNIRLNDVLQRPRQIFLRADLYSVCCFWPTYCQTTNDLHLHSQHARTNFPTKPPLIFPNSFLRLNLPSETLWDVRQLARGGFMIYRFRVAYRPHMYYNTLR